MKSLAPLKFSIRSFDPRDQPACGALHNDGRIGPDAPENDSGLDIDDIAAAYIRTAGNHFYVAESPGLGVVGMIGILHSDGMGEIRRLRVRNDVRGRGVGITLLEHAVRFCADQNYLKVALDTYIERDEAIRVFAKYQYRLDRARQYAGKEMIYFYLDLYTSDANDEPA
ncbi:MAG TPA: GNAT family N-acetyltransferase [Tepidisphaeraceae bacterium]